MTEEVKQTVEPKYEEAIKHLAEVSKAVEALAFEEVADPNNAQVKVKHPKPGMNYHFYIANVVQPLIKALGDPKTRNKALFDKVMALKPEEPLTSKFFKNPVG